MPGLKPILRFENLGKASFRHLQTTLPRSYNPIGPIKNGMDCVFL
jgi:hypothetical protein